MEKAPAWMVKPIFAGMGPLPAGRICSGGASRLRAAGEDQKDEQEEKQAVAIQRIHLKMSFPRTRESMLRLDSGSSPE